MGRLVNSAKMIGCMEKTVTRVSPLVSHLENCRVSYVIGTMHS